MCLPTHGSPQGCFATIVFNIEKDILSKTQVPKTDAKLVISTGQTRLAVFFIDKRITARIVGVIYLRQTQKRLLLSPRK